MCAFYVYRFSPNIFPCQIQHRKPFFPSLVWTNKQINMQKRAQHNGGAPNGRSKWNAMVTYAVTSGVRVCTDFLVICAVA